jgi:hypothetical protein
MSQSKNTSPGSRRMPSGSLFYERLVPIILLVFAVVLVLMLVAAVLGVVGVFHF